MTLPLETRFEHDPHTLALLGETNPNGLVKRSLHDGYGRRVRSTFVNPGDGEEYLASATTYLGATVVAPAAPFADPASGPIGDTIDPLGRRVLTRTYPSANVLASRLVPAPERPEVYESWTTQHVDALGRAYRSVRDLGLHYAGAQLVERELSFDALGRVSYAAASYVAGQGSPYGTSYLYGADDVLDCEILARGPTTELLTDHRVGRYVTCHEESYAGHLRAARVLGPTANDPTDPGYGVYEESISDGAGRLRIRTTKPSTQTASAMERMQLEYDVLGNTTAVRRHQAPEVEIGAQVIWRASYDLQGSGDRAEHAGRGRPHDRLRPARQRGGDELGRRPGGAFGASRA